MSNKKSKRPVNLKSVALPSEHGGWGFLIEPILLGLLVAFTWSGVLLAIAACGVFLIHQPLKIAVKDYLKGWRPPRFIWAIRFVVGYGLLIIVPALILLTTTPRTFLQPILLAIPLALTQLYYDARNRSRHLIPELCGALALATVAPAIAMLAGWALWTALPLWLLLALRAFTAILYIRTRIRLLHGKETGVSIVWGTHLLALVVVGGLATVETVPWLLLLPFVILLGRALMGLSRFGKGQSIKVIGFQEMGYGIMTVILIALLL